MTLNFISVYAVAQFQAGMHYVQPSHAEMADMTQRANHVVRLLEEFRRLYAPEGVKIDVPSIMSSDDHRPPKRPWEDMSQEGTTNAEAGSFPDVGLHHFLC